MSACEQIVVGPMIAGSLAMERDCRVDLSHWGVGAVLQGIADSPGMREDLTYWLPHQNLIIKLFQSQAKAASKMRARVEQERLS
jgi:hypothetical protein